MDQKSRNSLYEVIGIRKDGTKLYNSDIKDKSQALMIYDMFKETPNFETVLFCSKTPCFTGGNVDPDLC